MPLSFKKLFLHLTCVGDLCELVLHAQYLNYFASNQRLCNVHPQVSWVKTWIGFPMAHSLACFLRVPLKMDKLFFNSHQWHIVDCWWDSRLGYPRTYCTKNCMSQVFKVLIRDGFVILANTSRLFNGFAFVKPDCFPS